MTKENAVRALVKAEFDAKGGKGATLSMGEVLEAMGRHISQKEAEDSFHRQMLPPTLEYLRKEREKKNVQLAANGKADKVVAIDAKWTKAAKAKIAEIEARNNARAEGMSDRQKVAAGRKRQVSRCLSDMVNSKELAIVDQGVRDLERRFVSLRTFDKARATPATRQRKRKLAKAG